MPTDFLLIDNDAFVLLAGSGHLETLLAAIGRSLEQCRRLPALPFVFRKRIAKSLSQPVIARIEAMILRVKPLELAPSESIEGLLGSVPGIDVGEAVLYGVLAEHEAILLTTNDKHSMQAMCGTPALADIRNRIAGRVISVETIARCLVTGHGVASIAPGFVEVSCRDTFLSVAFSQANIANQEECLATIDSYLNDLRCRLGNDFLYTP